MLNTENLATYLIFTLVLIIALFNVVGAIIMMILDKQQNSRTLFSLGATIMELRQVYFIQGLLEFESLSRLPQDSVSTFPALTQSGGD